MQGSNDLVLVEKIDHVATVTLNRPEAMNALSRGLRMRFAEVMATLRDDEEIAVIILTGAGERAFSAGLDLKEISLEVSETKAGNLPGAAENAPLAVTQCKKPVIAAVNGVALTGGLELALACDFIIAAEHSRFADTHARLGIGPMGGLSQFLPRRIGVARAKELSFTGNFINAATAYDWGLVNRVVPSTDLMGCARTLAADIAGCSAPAVMLAKTLFEDGIDLPLPDALAMEMRIVSAFTGSRDSTEIDSRRSTLQARARTQ